MRSPVKDGTRAFTKCQVNCSQGFTSGTFALYDSCCKGGFIENCPAAVLTFYCDPHFSTISVPHCAFLLWASVIRLFRSSRPSCSMRKDRVDLDTPRNSAIRQKLSYRLGEYFRLNTVIFSPRSKMNMASRTASSGSRMAAAKVSACHSPQSVTAR